ncbi:uncharacterized protein LOC122505475 [Leptopilina heterotoma]|uniref:uncharacterized protein LOC122505475 n=1 Tax=Leptopilina heterotoma TaxID=63436 RepID=UPI001CA9C584|nr:uncharacterized protein LOC122505475 [Leptopilina heterotoma]
MAELNVFKQNIESDDEESVTEEIITDMSINEEVTNAEGESAIKKVARKKRKSVKSFQQEWFDEFPSWKEWVIRIKNDSQFYCKYCDKTLSCGRKEIRKHEETIKHIKKKEISIKMLRYGCIIDNVSNLSNNNIGILYQKNNILDIKIKNENDDDCTIETKGLTFKEKVRDAEHKITQLFLDNDIPFSLSSKVIGLFKEFEPLVLKNIKLSSSKMSLVAKEMCAKETGEEKIIFPRKRKKPAYKIGQKVKIKKKLQ